MGQISVLIQFAPNTIIRSLPHNNNYSAIKAAYNIHDAATNNVHGVSSGAIMGTAADETVTGEKTFDVGKLKVDTETRYYSVNPTAFHVADGANEADKNAAGSTLRNYNGSFGNRNFYTSINLPHGATVTSFKFYYYKDDLSALMSASLQKFDSTGTFTGMANVISSGETGNGSGEDTTITEPVIDNNGNSYIVKVGIDNNNSVNDAKYYDAVITYTIEQPLP